MRAIGECYHGAAPVFFTEYLGNKFVDSDGILLQDVYGPADFQCGGKDGYLGPWIRWAVVRRNSFKGVSLASRVFAERTSTPMVCPAISLQQEHDASTKSEQGRSSDVVTEHDTFECEVAGAVAGGYKVNVSNCDQCSVRPGFKTDDNTTATWSNSDLWRDTAGQLLETGEGTVLHAPDGLYYMYGNRYMCVPNNQTCFGKVFETTFAVYLLREILV